MSKLEKQKQRLLEKPKDYKWSELKSLLISMGYRESNSGKTSGSRVRFIHKIHGQINLHKPHPKPVLKSYQVKQIVDQLKKEGLL
tara:strand:+ start:206 stop:460 length:255 start_codon:yes stop_codon:yes gene_type:complete